METPLQPHPNTLFALTRQSNLSDTSNSASTSMSTSSEDDMGCLSPFATHSGSSTQPSSSELDTPPQSPLDEVNVTSKQNGWCTEMIIPKSYLERFLLRPTSNVHQIRTNRPNLALTMNSDAEGGYESGTEEALTIFTKSSKHPRSRRSAALLGNTNGYRGGGEKKKQITLHGALAPPRLPETAHTTAARVARRHNILSQQKIASLSRSSSEESSAYSDSSPSNFTTLRRPPRLTAAERLRPIDLSSLRPPVFRSDLRQNVKIPPTSAGLGIVLPTPKSTISSPPAVLLELTAEVSPGTPEASPPPLKSPNIRPQLPSSRNIIRTAISMDETLSSDGSPPGAPLLRCAEFPNFPESSQAETQEETSFPSFLPPPSPPPTTAPHCKMLPCIPLPLLSPLSDHAAEMNFNFDSDSSASSKTSRCVENTLSTCFLLSSDISPSPSSPNTRLFSHKTVPEATNIASPIPPRLRSLSAPAKHLPISAPSSTLALCLTHVPATKRPLTRSRTTPSATLAYTATQATGSQMVRTYTMSSTSMKNALQLILEEPEPKIEIDEGH